MAVLLSLRVLVWHNKTSTPNHLHSLGDLHFNYICSNLDGSHLHQPYNLLACTSLPKQTQVYSPVQIDSLSHPGGVPRFASLQRLFGGLQPTG